MFKTKISAVIALFKGILISYIITMLVFFIFALLIIYTDLSETYISTVIKVTTTLVCIISGFITAASAEKSGLIWGMISGVLYAVIMCIVGFILIPDYNLSPKLLITLAIALGGGGLGGIIGINIR